MKIEKCTLKNIGCFTEKTFEFSNLNVVFGENRTGKSTLVYALFFAIFGKHLNTHLNVKDLCRKGEESGTADIYFRDNGDFYKLSQGTDRTARIYMQENDENWQDITVNDPGDMKKYIPLDSETASLSSFFRESELIYFLQDIPRYNKTLLQSLIGMDQALILRSRFNKAHLKAKEFKKAVLNAAPKRPHDPLNMELARRQIAGYEKELIEIEAEYKILLSKSPPDPTVFKLLQNQYENKKKQKAALIEMKNKFPEAGELEKIQAELEKELIEEQNFRSPAQVLEELGKYEREGENLHMRAQGIMRLENETLCPLCGQEVPREQISALLSELKIHSNKTLEKQDFIKKELEKIELREKQKSFGQKRLEQTRQHIKEVRALETHIKELDEQMSLLEADLKAFGPMRQDVHNAETIYKQKEKLEIRRAFLQKEIISSKVAVKQYEDILKRTEESQKNLKNADRNVLICSVAYQAIDDALQSLGNRILEKVRESILGWIHHFTFLNRFDIEMGGNELLPVIQAKGYQYKLNQMSKSERIFLYLMLKLAIGDALGHLGMFILDDPADGLDMKRKQTLAYLLSEVAKKRQIIITTNDLAFAEIFSGASQIIL